MKRVHVDIETRSLADLPEVGAWEYAYHPSTEIICLCYCFDDGPVELWFEGQAVPPDLWSAAINPSYGFHAFNVGFERRIWAAVCVEKMGWPEVPLERWFDTQADALAMGFPVALGRCAKAMKVHYQKGAEGTKLINLLSKPIKGTERFRTRKEFPQQFLDMYEYCRQDVACERAISKALTVETTRYGQEREIWAMTERINDRGVPVDHVLVDALYALVEFELYDRATQDLIDMTEGRVESGTEISKMNKELDYPLENFQAATLIEALKCPLLSDKDRTIMEARQVFSNTSTAKFKKMSKAYGKDHYVRDILQYHGAATGRYAGRGIQIQNFPRSAHKYADEVARFVVEPDNTLEDIEKKYGPLQDLAKTMLRPSIRAPYGKTILCRDYSSIEARGTAWATLDEDQLEAFRAGKDIYIATASDMYDIPYDSIDPDSPKRQAGKIAVLACGYQGGWKALRDFAVGYGVFWTPKESWTIVQDFRGARPNLVKAWANFDSAAQQALFQPGKRFEVKGVTPCAFRMEGRHLSMELPNGKRLWFPYAKIETLKVRYETHEGEMKIMVRESVTHMWTNSNGQWLRRGIHGGSLFQSYIQAICREIMCEAMLRLEDNGFPINGTVHDEIFTVLDEEEAIAREQEFEDLMTAVPPWADGFPIDAGGWMGRRYRK
jgi:DNA polymerase